jgi:basic membrane protein A and related proteins
MKKSLRISMALIAILVFVMAGCTPAATPAATQAPAAPAATQPPAAPAATEAPAATQPPAAPAATEAPAAKTYTCALITPNPLGDGSFIDAAARGIKKANAELPVKCDIIETNGVSEHEAALRSTITKGYDLILALAIDPTLLTNIAKEFPDQKFASPSDLLVDKLEPNILAYQIDVHESSFLVGVIVGSLTKTKTVGAVVGGDAPGLNQFYFGYKQGVMAVCPDCKVLVSYLGFDFSNPTLGLETALGQYDKGADIIYQVAGRSGEGVLQAAAQRKLFAIGVDSNQDDTQPGNVIVSSLKKTDSTTFDAIKLLTEGQFKGGQFLVKGLKDGFSGLSWDDGSTTFEKKGPADMTAKLADVKALVEQYRTKILNGELKVCNAVNPETDECKAVITK